jgi:hypothetical protein
MEFSELNVDGYCYESAAVVPDDIRVYEPSTRPDARYRTHGSMTRTGAAARSRTSSRRGGSC